MAIKIPKKNPVVSNKSQTLPEIPENGTSASSASLPKLKAFIDKITIFITPPSAEEQKAIYAAFYSIADDKTLFVGAKHSKKFTIAKRIVLGDDFDEKSRPYLSIATQDKRVTKLRLEFSPADIGVGGMTSLHAALVVFLPNGWQFAVENGLATKIEVTVDIPKVHIANLHFLPSQTTSARTWSNSGQLQTLVLGKAKSGKQIRIYDRAAKRAAMGQFPSEYEGTRVEAIFRLARPISKLKELPNPFAGMAFVMAPSPPPTEPKDYIWTMFMDSVVARTLPVALKLLPVEKRTLYRKWFKQHTLTLWQPDEFWKEWPSYLLSSGLLHGEPPQSPA